MDNYCHDFLRLRILEFGCKELYDIVDIIICKNQTTCQGTVRICHSLFYEV